MIPPTHAQKLTMSHSSSGSGSTAVVASWLKRGRREEGRDFWGAKWKFESRLIKILILIPPSSRPASYNNVRKAGRRCENCPSARHEALALSTPQSRGDWDLFVETPEKSQSHTSPRGTCVTLPFGHHSRNAIFRPPNSLLDSSMTACESSFLLEEKRFKSTRIGGLDAG